MTQSPEPGRLSVSAISFDGGSSNDLDTPDSTATSVTGDLDIRVNVALADWTPAAWAGLVSKSVTDSANDAYAFEIDPTGKPVFSWGPNSTSVVIAASTAAVPAADGQTLWVRATRKQNNGAGGNDTKFYTSTDGSSWTQLGATVTKTGTAAVFDNTAALQVGAYLGTENVNGRLFAAQIYNGIAGNRVVDFEAQDVNPGTPSPYTDSVGVVWSFHGTGWHADTATAVAMPGTSGNYLDAPDSAALSVTGDIDLRAKVKLNNWSPVNCIAPITKGTTPYATNYSYGLEVCGTKLDFTWSANGTSVNDITSVNHGIADGATKWIRATMKVNNGASGRDIKFYLSDDGATWTQLGSTVTQAGTTSIVDKTSNLYLGNWLGSEWIDGKLYAAQVYNGINGTKVADFQATSLNPASPSPYSDWTGTTWTFHGTANTVDTTATGTQTLNIAYDSYDHATVINDGTNTTTETLTPSGRVLRHKQTRNSDNAVIDDTIYGYADGGDSPNWSQPAAGGPLTTYCSDRTITQTDPATAGTASYFVADPHGDLVGTTTVNGTFTARQTTDEFGNAATGALGRLGWLGIKERFSAQDGIIRMGVRLYDPASGRFLEEDPVAGGSCNEYDYSCQDPVNHFDIGGDRCSKKCRAQIGRATAEYFSLVAQYITARARYNEEVRWEKANGRGCCSPALGPHPLVCAVMSPLANGSAAALIAPSVGRDASSAPRPSIEG